ncbi:hypothetical protein ES703_83965 [subsurface metagenome]
MVGQEEQQYEQLRKLAQELHIPIPEAFWELEVRDKDGNIIQRHRQRSHSWTRNAYNLLFSQLAAKDGDDDTFGTGKLNLKDIAGAVKYADAPICVSVWERGEVAAHSCDTEEVFGYRGAAGAGDVGIVVGSGTTAEDFESYQLAAIIAHGTLPGELVYVESEELAASYAALTMTVPHVRYFNNNSGGDVSVNEVAIYAQLGNGSSPYIHKTMVTRDKLATTVTVPDTGQLKVTYTIQQTYPS